MKEIGLTIDELAQAMIAAANCMNQKVNDLEDENNKLRMSNAGIQGNIAGSKLRQTMWKIIELTTVGDVNVWGQDDLLGTKDELIDKALDIIKNEAKNNQG